MSKQSYSNESILALPNEPHSSLPPPWDRIFSLSTRIFVWGSLFLVLYLLQSFFLLIFLTFVFAYIQANGAERLAPHVQNRTRRVILFSSLFLSILIALSLYLTPRVIQQTQNFITQFNVYTQKIDQVIWEFSARHYLLEEIMQQLRDPEEAIKSDQKSSPPSITKFFLRQLSGFSEENIKSHEKIEQLLGNVKQIGEKIISTVSAFLLALLFSFLIVLDLPVLSASIRSLENTKLRFIYVEVAESIHDFGLVLGQAFEAQFLIALVNTLLTALGLSILGVGKHIAFLSVIVFLSSFVPVVGVFISSIPICLVALQVSGMHAMLAAIGLIILVHLLEGYLLNPKIYGYRLRINPVIVLIILTIGGKLFYFWGLILGVPVCTYIFAHAIRYKS
jgi:predicted PurR-regulated permease PerM